MVTRLFIVFQCNIETWGANCSNKCDCGIHGKGCDVSTGACFCKPGFTGGKSQIGLVYGV
jgi:hypothetical protein